MATGVYSDLTGKKFGRLTVLKRGKDYARKDGTSRPGWLCKCECGKTINVRGNELKRGNTRSCGCLAHEFQVNNGTKNGRANGKKSQLKDHRALHNFLWWRIKSRAKKAGYEFTLTVDQVWKLGQLPCYYCGAPPSNTRVYHNIQFTYSGIDRVDSNKGYIPINVVPCCRYCNSSKHDKPVAEFIKSLPNQLPKWIKDFME